MIHYRLIGLALLPLVSFALASTALAADDGLITVQSRHSVKETVARFAEAVRSREAIGFMVFNEIDHAAAAKKFGLMLRPRTVIVFGNPKLGTPVMVKTPTLAIDVPPKALVWEDDEGKVWLTYNSSEYLAKVIYVRHGLSADQPWVTTFAGAVKAFADHATQ
jgi:uncharacterized protein (DUF302 family)